MDTISNTCIHCGKETANPKFCSRSCAVTLANRQRPKRKSDHRCQSCNCSVQRRNKYCRECRQEAMVKAGKLLDWSGVTIGSITTRAKYQVHAYIRALARAAFKKTGKPLMCHLCGYDKHVEIAHKKAIKDFADDALVTEINQPSNLLSLCPNCHWEFDNGFLTI